MREGSEAMPRTPFDKAWLQAKEYIRSIRKHLGLFAAAAMEGLKSKADEPELQQSIEAQTIHRTQAMQEIATMLEELDANVAKFHAQMLGEKQPERSPHADVG